ncbi:MAG: carboxylating nicotinate-nucleotide diphosphorylase [Gammaproteobacteria bacterium]|nr:carboxylating nicotinate-nucleotide diphosphorylase [Gammaproteobacteria bacterium]
MALIDHKQFQAEVLSDIQQSLVEDIGSGDLTAQLIDADCRATARVICREQAVICGRPWFDQAFMQLDPDCRIKWQVEEGRQVDADTELCQITGLARALLSAERTALNWLQALSGTASLAHDYAQAVTGTNATVLDTRKTVPGLRIAQKYAVKTGGCENHRIGLHDAILIKENHILACGSLQDAVNRSRQDNPDILIELEVENFQQLREAVLLPLDRIMLDNFSLAELRQAVEFVNGRVALEASGNVNLDTIRSIAETGVDYISVGLLTKDIKAVDLSMRVILDN